MFSRTLPACFVLVVSALPFLPSPAADWPQWRGPGRNGHSTEVGLAKAWPKEGPSLVWRVADLGNGYAAPSVVGDRLYVLGNEGLEDEFVEARQSRDGQRVWRTRLGKVGNPRQNPAFPAARSTPTVDGDAVYALGSDGDLVCVQRSDGAVRWRRSLRSDFAGKPGEWAYSESPLVDGDVLVVSPGGSESPVVALNKRSGEILWKAALPETDAASFASPIALETGGVRQYVLLAQKGLVGLEATSGKLLWRFDKAVSRYGANIPSPLAGGDVVYAGSAGTGGGAVRLQASGAGAVTAEPLYFESKLPTAIGGAVKVGDFLYGTTAQALLCAEFATGRIRWEERSIGAASSCVAEGRLYLHGENGEVAMVEASPEGYRERGRFTPPDRPKHAGMEKSWAYPVLADGRLYLRDHAVMWCYTVK